MRWLSLSFISVLFTLLSSNTVQADSGALLQEFNIALRQCALRYPSYVVSASVDHRMARESCYNRFVKSALLDMPPDTPARLEAALLVAPDYAESTFRTVLALGMDPYFATTYATSILPKKDDLFAQVAIASGADPNKTLMATAAGKSKD